MLPMAVARSSSGGVVIRYILFSSSYRLLLLNAIEITQQHELESRPLPHGVVVLYCNEE